MKEVTAVVCRSSIQNKRQRGAAEIDSDPPSNEYIEKGYDTRNKAALCYSLKSRIK